MKKDTMTNLEFSRMLNGTIYSLLVLMVVACQSGTETPGQVNIVEPTVALPSSTWELYTNETWKFSLEHPTVWVVSSNGTNFGFIGRQVFWWVSNDNPMQQHGDDPAVNELTEIEIDGQPATRVLGHYQGAIGDMGFQQYLRYVIHKGDVFYMFTLVAVDALGVPPSLMSERLPLREDDLELFEQMIATVKFKE
jgi:hypothetical protein